MSPSSNESSTIELTSVETLEKYFPWIYWREPLMASTASGAAGFACRICVAQLGLKASQIAGLPQNMAEFDEHLKTVHNVTRNQPSTQRKA